MAFVKAAVRSQGSSQSANAIAIIDRAYDTVAPGVGDDTLDGFIIGSIWERRASLSANGAINELYVCTDATAGSAVWKKLAEADVAIGRKIRYIEEAVIFAAAASANFTEQVPAGAIPLAASMNYDTAVVLSTAVKVGLGTAADPDGYGLTGTAVIKNTKHAPGTGGKGALCGVQIATATTIQVTACDTAGALAGTVTSGTVRGRVYYETWDGIADAA